MTNKEKNILYSRWINYISTKLMPILPQNTIEGNIYTKHLIKEPDPFHRSKQINFFNLFEKYRFNNILEIGFNAGFSSVMMSILESEAKITGVDICTNNYVEGCFNIIRRDFNNINLLKGDSTTILPLLKQSSQKFDLIHIDGCHLADVARIDLENSLEMLTDDGIIVFDDTNNPDLSNLCNEFINNKKIIKLNFEKKVIDSKISDHDFFTKPNFFKYSGVRTQDLEAQQDSVWDDLYKKYIPKNSIIYDIGAFRGVTARGFAKTKNKVYAFEGSPRNYNYLVENTKDFDNITCYNKAIHVKNYSTETKFNDYIVGGEKHPKQKIDYVVLPEFIKENNIPQPDFIKIDIEGMESVVFNTFSEWVDNKVIWQLSTHEGFPGYGLDYPGWVPSDRGGFNFDTLLSSYNVLTKDGKRVNSINGFNEFFLIPKK